MDACSPGDICAPLPDGWSGPVVASSGGSCDAEYSAEALVGFASAEVPESTCDCECGASSAECEEPTTLHAFFGPSTCEAGGSSWTISEGFQIPIGNLTGDRDLLFEPLVPTSGSCPPSSDQEIPEPLPQDAATFCSLPVAPLECKVGEGVCVPQTNARCVFRDGEHACPTDYPSANTLFQSVVDTRSCSACTCSTASGSCPDAFVEFHNPDDELLYVLPTATCMPMPVGDVCGAGMDLICTEDYVELFPGSLTASCAPSASSLSGAATPADPVTVCCN